ncbi:MULTISPECIES: ABC transporter permease [unclassified Cellulomonas]|uniref:ABC transporter permease n=1 Tax=unclassified Cellulomonas TaxID=2620175 RepID=UPI0024B736C4|nr:ABC transporter permease [Cellulomonas sp. ES6]WHP18766.1 ABC transporter permease [Cellulomonas sp. ES6]
MTSPTTPRPRPATPSAVQSTLMVAEREIVTQVRTKSFLISTGILLLLVLGGIVLTSLLGDKLGGGDTKVAVVPATASVIADVDGLEPVDAADADEARALVESEEVSAAILPDEDAGNPLGIVVVGLDSAPDDVVGALAVTPPVELLDDSATPAGLRYLVSLLFGLVFLMAASSFGGTIAQNTVQEKQSRIVEILLSTVPPRALLAGKILGNTVLAVGQIAAIAAVAVVGLVVTGQDDVLSLVGAPVAWFVLFFLVGFVLLAAMFASAASLVSRIEDTGSVLTPVIMLVMIPYFGVIFFNDNDTVLTVMSYVPFSAAVGMPVRLFLGQAAWWEPLLSLAVLVVSAAVVTAIGARIYERSVLRTGRRVKLSEALAKAA